ncbi:MAG: hypothetical protein JJW00_09590 [Sulfurimonas sp.]|nr:hypothetical protein [Sulfurimonas sp.]
MKAKLHKQILAKLSKIVDIRTLQQLEIITIAIMSMTGRVTMLGISRWSDRYSYKTIDWLEIKLVN